MDDAVTFRDVHGRVVYHREFAVGELVEREPVLVVLRKVERVFGECRCEGSAHDVGDSAFGSAGKRLLDEVEDAVPVACENNLVVVDPVHVAFVVACVAYDFEVLAVGVDDGDAARAVVEEPECDSLAVGAELGAVDVVVAVLGVGNKNVYRVFGGVVIDVLGVGNLGKLEPRAVGLAQGEGDGGPLRVEGGVDGVGEVGDRDGVLVGVAYGDVKMRMAVAVAVLVTYVGEDGALHAVFVHVDALVEPSLLDAESVLGVVADVDGRVLVLDFDVADFHAVNLFGGILDRGAVVRAVCCGAFRFDFEQPAVEPGAAEVRDAVQVVARDYGEVLPEGAFGHLGALDERSEAVALCLVLFGNRLLPVVVEFLLANAEDLLDGAVEREAVELGHLVPNLGDGVFAVGGADVAHERESLRVGAEFREQRVVREVVHVGERKEAVVQGGHAQ